MKRRSLLLAGSAAFAMSALGSHKLLAADETKTAVLCFTDIGADTPPAMLSQIVQAFISRHIPVSCAVTFDSPAAGAPVMQVIKNIGDREPGLFEVMAALPEREHGARYFQMREADNLRQAIVENLFPESRRADRFPVISIFDQYGHDGLDFPAFRSAGFRTLVRLQSDSDSPQLVSVGREQIEISGGVQLDLARSNPPRAEEINQLLEMPGLLLITVSLSLDDGVDPGQLIERCTRLAESIDGNTATGHLFATRPTDLLLHTTEQPAPIAAVLLRPPESEAEDDPIRIFAKALAESGIPYTTMVGPDGSTGPETAAFCSIYAADGTANRIFDCTVLPAETPLALNYPSPFTLLPHNSGGAWTSLMHDGRFRIAALGGPNMRLADLMPAVAYTDEVIIIYPENVATFLQRARLVNRLAFRLQSGRLKLETVDGFARHLIAPDPVFERFQSARKRMYSDPPLAQSIEPAERENLLEDARLAWLYIDRFTHSQTGLCAGTVRGGPSPLIHQSATMWDVASQLQGIVAAHKLAIIDLTEAQERAGQMLDHLPTAKIGDLSLPPAFFSTATSRSTRAGFDFCDSGRFFTALTAAQNAGLVTPERGQEVFDGWDIGQAARDSHPFDYKQNNWVDSQLSHCVPYSSRGLAAWGIALESPYPDMEGEDAADARMRLLYSVANIGHYGTEPILLEAIELGASPASQYLAEVLFDAQLSSFERTGQLKCASETLLDYVPWFSYQGMRLDKPEEDGWVIAAPNTAPQYHTEAFQTKSEVISSKSAYLWGASYPHPYSDRLVNFIREKARAEGIGFTAGVYTQTGEAMANYCDINTNGIILSAIAHMLHPPG